MIKVWNNFHNLTQDPAAGRGMRESEGGLYYLFASKLIKGLFIFGDKVIQEDFGL